MKMNEPNERDCENCVHKKLVEIKGTFVYCCEKWDCEFESKDGDDE